MKTEQANTPFQRYRIAGLKGAVESFEMFDSCGNCAAAALFDLGVNDENGERLFQLSLWPFNNALPTDYRGPLRLVKNWMEHFFRSKEEQGFFCAQEVPAQRNVN